MEIDFKLLVLIFVINLVYITLNTIRIMLTMKGYRKIAPVISMIEVTVYVLGLNMVLNKLDNPINLVIYALGYGAGISVGIWLEDKLALGYIMVTVILPAEEGGQVPEALREAGYGVTVSYGTGREGDRLVLEILSERKYERALYKRIEELDPRSFVISHEPKYISGGFWTKRVKGRRRQIKQKD